MIQVRRNFYNYAQLAGTFSVPAAISGGQLQNGDILLYATTQIQYGSIQNGALVLSTD